MMVCGGGGVFCVCGGVWWCGVYVLWVVVVCVFACVCVVYGGGGGGVCVGVSVV